VKHLEFSSRVAKPRHFAHTTFKRRRPRIVLIN